MKEIKFRVFDKGAFTYFDLDLLNDESRAFYINEIKDNNVMQYTGLKDKNGVLIFEGDIVTTPYRDTNGYIYYSAPTCGLKDKTGVCVDFTWEDFNEFEVIGNIYENKELLNTKGITK